MECAESVVRNMANSAEADLICQPLPACQSGVRAECLQCMQLVIDQVDCSSSHLALESPGLSMVILCRYGSASLGMQNDFYNTSWDITT